MTVDLSSAALEALQARLIRNAVALEPASHMVTTTDHLREAAETIKALADDRMLTRVALGTAQIDLDAARALIAEFDEACDGPSGDAEHDAAVRMSHVLGALLADRDERATADEFEEIAAHAGNLERQRDAAQAQIAEALAVEPRRYFDHLEAADAYREAYDAMRAILSRGAQDAAETSEWEFGIKVAGQTHAVSDDVGRTIRQRDAVWPVTGTIMRRMKAGPWERYDAEEGNRHE